jgi:transcription-repair coupling factor (superfamily II helicase)
MQEELVDRFGSPPEPAQALLACHRLRLVAKPKGISKVDAGPERSTISFVKSPPFDPASLIALVQKDGRIASQGRIASASSARRRRSRSASRWSATFIEKLT